jgi:hypothetical protein
MNTTTVLTQDLWDALDAVPEAKQTEWYKRFEEAVVTVRSCEIPSMFFDRAWHHSTTNSFLK